MKEIITILLATILVAGLSSVYAEEDPDKVFVFWTLHEDRKEKTTIETWYAEIDTGGKDKKITITQGEDETPEEFFLRVSDAIRILTKPPVPEMTEAEIFHAEAVKQSEEKREEIKTEREQRYEDAVRCTQPNSDETLYGTQANSVFQSEKEDVILQKMIYFKHLPTDYQSRKLLVDTEACLTFGESYLSQSREYYGMFVGERDKYVPPSYDNYDTPHTDPVTQRDLDKEAQDALNTPRPYRDPYIGCIPIDDADTRCENRGDYSFDKVCQFNPSTQRVDLCPKQALAKYHIQEISTEGTAMTILCKQAYKLTWHGTTSKTWWPDLLVDGTCDTLIDELVETRGDYVREDWKGQTKANCPDCQRFKE